MINQQLLNPRSIAVIGGSDNIHKPGGKILRNLIEGHFEGDLHVVNSRAIAIEGAIYHESISQLPPVDLAILAIPAQACPSATRELAHTKHTRAFIVISAGFSEDGPEGAQLEKEILNAVNEFNACLIGPNCIGVLTSSHHSLFTSPIPELDPHGCDFISGSGATAVFIMESGIPKGLKFSSVFSVGNSAQTGVEEILQYMDEHYEHGISSPIKLLYMESIRDPDKLLHHASSLIRKGCKIAAIKSGSSDAGSRAATSHTGALASPDLAVEALFRKAGIVRCHGREELTTIASIFTLKEPRGKRIAIITHAGGPAVMLTDALTKGGLEVPVISGKEADELKSILLPGASVSNPIDLLATGTADQLGMVIDYCENVFEDVDAMMVIFGSPGLVEVYDAYEVLHEKMSSCTKPIFPILPSMITARDEVQFFLSKGHVNFPDEVSIGSAMVKVMNTPKPAPELVLAEGVNIPSIRGLIHKSTNGYQDPEFVQKFLKAANIPVVPEEVVVDKDEALARACELGYPVVAKVVGPLHKTDVGGVVLNIKTPAHLELEFNRLMQLPEARAVLIQPMIKGIELFIGAKYESRFGHVVMCGLGGIFVEVLKDVSSGLAPLTKVEALSMIRSLRGYPIIRGTRGRPGIDEEQFAGILVKLSTLLRFATEIKEMDLNPLLATPGQIIAVDARIRVEK